MLSHKNTFKSIKVSIQTVHTVW